jgi:fermentation-respiration switch protein FrsA (DUF1100 family)
MGCWLPDIRPVDQIHKLRSPLLIIHAEGDELIPADHARRLYERAMEPKALWISNTGGHTSSLGARSQYLQAIREFVEEPPASAALASPPTPPMDNKRFLPHL